MFKPMQRFSILFFAFILTLLTTSAHAKEDRSLAPFFHVKGGPAEADNFPLKDTHAEVDIAGVIAKVRIIQVYANDGKVPLEAIYTFPGSTRAAVFGLTINVANRRIRAKIKERQEAQKIYDQANRQGKSASLLTQERPNVFQMKVANIMPGDTVSVELEYTELLVPEDGKYKFVYPAVVGPRYTENKNAGKDSWTHQPYMRKGAQASYTFGLSLNLNSAVPVHNIKSTSHAIDVEKRRNGAQIFLKDGSHGGDRDFIMNYELRGQALSTGLMLLEGKKENFFLMMMQPPKRVAAREMPSREYVFIVDVSGSMHGFPLDTAKEVLEGLMGGMRARDKFNVLMFSGGSRVLGARSIAATPRNIAGALEIMDGIRGGGGTRLLPALKHALKMPAAPNTSRTFVVITDGYVSVESEAYKLVRNSLNKANLFAFGIGSSVNRHLVESLARAGMGEAFVVTDQATVHKKVARFHRYISTPALTNIDLKFDGFTVHDVEPKQIPDVFSERPIVVFGKYTGTPRGHIRVKGKTGTGTFSKSINVSRTSPHSGNEALRYLWARNRISQLSDKMSMSRDGTFKKAITQLGLSYNLLTQFTSFVAVDERIRNTSGRVEKVVQPLPLPAGVEESAVEPPSLLSAMGTGSVGSLGMTVTGRGSGGGGVSYGMGAKGRSYGSGGRGMAKIGKSTPKRKMKSRYRGHITLNQNMAPPTKEAEETEEETGHKQKESRKIARFKLVSVSGALRTQEVHRIINKWIARLLSCQNSGTSLVKIVVDRYGKIVSLIALSQNKSKQGTQSCIGALKSRIKFPTSRGKSTIRILLNH